MDHLVGFAGNGLHFTIGGDDGETSLLDGRQHWSLADCGFARVDQRENRTARSSAYDDSIQHDSNAGDREPSFVAKRENGSLSPDVRQGSRLDH